MSRVSESVIVAVQPYGKCQKGGCPGTAMYKVMMPKASKHSGNPYTVRYFCVRCKNEFVEQVLGKVN